MPIHTEQLYVLGIPWDGTFVAASVAAAVALLSWIFTHRQIDRLNARQTWFARYELAGEHLQDRENDVRFAGLKLLQSMAGSSWATKEDKQLADEAIELFEHRVKGKRNERPDQ